MRSINFDSWAIFWALFGMKIGGENGFIMQIPIIRFLLLFKALTQFQFEKKNYFHTFHFNGKMLVNVAQTININIFINFAFLFFVPILKLWFIVYIYESSSIEIAWPNKGWIILTEAKKPFISFIYAHVPDHWW